MRLPLPRIFRVPDKPVRKRMNHQDESLLTPRSYCYHMPPSAALIADGTKPINMQLRMTSARMHVIDLREKERSVEGCNLSDNRSIAAAD